MFDLSDNMYILRANNYATLIRCSIIILESQIRYLSELNDYFGNQNVPRICYQYITMHLFQ